MSEISLSCTFCRCLILVPCLFDSYVLLADDHVNNVSYFPFMSIKKVVCVLREGYYVIIWLIVRICMFIKEVVTSIISVLLKGSNGLNINIKYPIVYKVIVRDNSETIVNSEPTSDYKYHLSGA